MKEEILQIRSLIQSGLGAGFCVLWMFWRRLTSFSWGGWESRICERFYFNPYMEKET